MSRGRSALFEQYVKLSNNLHYDAMLAAVRVDDPGQAGRHHRRAPGGRRRGEAEPARDRLAAQERLNRIAAILEAEIDKLHVDRRIQGRVKKQMEQAQKEYYLNEKMKAIQKELGRKDEKGNEVDELRKKIEQARMPKEAEEKALQELKRLEVDAADVGRGHRLAQLPRLADRGALEQEDPREPRPQARREDPQRGPLRPREGQGADPRVPRRAPAGQEAEGPDPLLRRAPRASARPRSPSRSPAPRAASSCASRWAACATRPRSAATAAPTSAPSPARSSR